jgi:hypothetical protein
MLLTFLLGIGCGLAVPRVEQPLRTAIEKISLIKLKLEPAEMDVVSVLVLMIGASLICGLLDISSSAFPAGARHADRPLRATHHCRISVG